MFNFVLELQKEIAKNLEKIEKNKKVKKNFSVICFGQHYDYKNDYYDD